jgi:flagellar biogenesis protein FliO
MPALKKLVWIGCLWGSLSLATVGVQAQSGAFSAAPQRGPYVIDEPRAFPPAGMIGAQPLPVEFAPPPHQQQHPQTAHPPLNRQPPVNFRQVSAEEPVPQSKPTLRLAPRSEHARSGVPKPAATSPGQALGTVAASLGIVLGLFLVVVWGTRKLAPGGAAPLPKEAVELLGRVPLAPRQHMQLIRVGNKLLLVSLSAGSAETLTEITDPAEVEQLTALCRRGQPGSASTVFKQTLAQLASEPAPRGFVGASRPTSGATR